MSEYMNPALRVRTTLLMLRRGEAAEMLRELGRRLHSKAGSCVLRRDLTLPLKRRAAKIPIRIRPLAADDLPQIIAERPRRLPVLRANIPTCYVAETTGNAI